MSKLKLLSFSLLFCVQHSTFAVSSRQYIQFKFKIYIEALNYWLSTLGFWSTLSCLVFFQFYTNINLGGTELKNYFTTFIAELNFIFKYNQLNIAVNRWASMLLQVTFLCPPLVLVVAWDTMVKKSPVT